MSYTNNFGFRSFLNIIRVSRFRVPSTGDPITIGTPVMLDPANAGRLKVATEAVAPGAGKGVLIYEHIQPKGVDPLLSVPTDFTTVPVGAYAQMVSGPGVKVWMKGTAILNAGVDVATLDPGDGLVPDDEGKYRVADPNEDEVPWFVIEQANASTDVLEARITF